MIKNQYTMRFLHNSTTVYNNDKKHLSLSKRPSKGLGYFPYFLIKYVLFSYCSKSHKNYAKVS
jgi:hypothetical protein